MCELKPVVQWLATSILLRVGLVTTLADVKFIHTFFWVWEGSIGRATVGHAGHVGPAWFALQNVMHLTAFVAACVATSVQSEPNDFLE